MTQFPYGVSPQQLLPPINTNTNIDPRSHAPVSQPTVSGAPSVSPTDSIDQTEDKRRRNTAASARFRIKKKQRSLNLDRSLSDLTGRAEELEREAAELRRENGWLKEIVVLKGRSLSGTTQSEQKGGDTSDESEESDDEDSGAASRKRAKTTGKGKGKEKQ